MRPASRVVVLGCAIAVLAWLGFRAPKTETPRPPPPVAESPVPLPIDPAPAATASEWAAVTGTMDRWEGTLPGTEAGVVLYRFAPKKYAWKLATGAPKTVDEWAAALPQAAFVANGGYFNEDGTPSGFLRADGKRVGERQFDLDRSALLTLGSAPAITHPTEKELDAGKADAVQSYPVLVEAGKAAVTTDSGYAARRTFFGLDADGNAYVGLVPDRFVTLHELSVGLMQLPVRWTSVLNLDGGPSSGASLAGAEGRQFPSLSPVGNVLYAVPAGAGK